MRNNCRIDGVLIRDNSIDHDDSIIKPDRIIILMNFVACPDELGFPFKLFLELGF
jgi:hypothetical protein